MIDRTDGTTSDPSAEIEITTTISAKELALAGIRGRRDPSLSATC